MPERMADVIPSSVIAYAGANASNHARTLSLEDFIEYVRMTTKRPNRERKRLVFTGFDTIRRHDARRIKIATLVFFFSPLSASNMK